MTVPPELVARARGLSTQLLERSVLDGLAGAPDTAALGRELQRQGARLEPIGDVSDPSAIERAIDRTSGRLLRTLARWQSSKGGPVDVFTWHQDHRNTRALIRGAWQGAPASQRVAGLLPTPLLPLPVLSDLAQLPSPAAVVSALARLRHPDTAALAPLVTATQPDLLPIDVALLKGMARRTIAVARRGDHTLRQFAQQRVDVGNLQNALLAAGAAWDADPESLFVDGGKWLPREVFVDAARLSTRASALTDLAGALADTPLAPAVPPAAGRAGDAERAWLDVWLARLAKVSRLDPLSSAPVLLVLLGIEAQARDLRALAWGAALGAPPDMRRQELVTPWR